MKDGSSLVVTPSIPNSTTGGPDVDLSSKGSQDVLEDPDDKPVLKKRISNSDDEKDASPETEFMGMCLSPFFFVFLTKSIPPPFFVISSLGLGICVSPLLQFPFNLYVYFRILQRLLKG